MKEIVFHQYLKQNNVLLNYVMWDRLDDDNLIYQFFNQNNHVK